MKTADPELMRAINRFHVMDAIRRFGPISRVEISERTDLSPTTVSAITAALLDDGLIVPRPIGAVTRRRARPAARHARAQPGRGLRRRREARPRPDHHRGHRISRATCLRTLSLPMRVDRQPVPVIADLVEDGVRRCVADAGSHARARSAASASALPGVVEQASGLCRQSPIFARARRAASARSSPSACGVPTTIDSDVNLITLAEHWFGHGRDLDDFLVVSVEHSLGLGIMHGGELFRGANGLSPDLGDLIVSFEQSRRRVVRDASRSSPRRRRSWPRRRSHRGRPTRGACAGHGPWTISPNALDAGDAPTATIFDDAGRGARPRDRQSHHAVRAAQGHPRRLDPGARRPAASTRSAAPVAGLDCRRWLADVAEIVVDDCGDDILGARRRGR